MKDAVMWDDHIIPLHLFVSRPRPRRCGPSTPPVVLCSSNYPLTPRCQNVRLERKQYLEPLFSLSFVLSSPLAPTYPVPSLPPPLFVNSSRTYISRSPRAEHCHLPRQMSPSPPPRPHPLPNTHGKWFPPVSGRPPPRPYLGVNPLPLPLPLGGPPRPPRPRPIPPLPPRSATSFLALFLGFAVSSIRRVSRGSESGRMK